MQESFLDARDRLRHLVEKPEQSFVIWLRTIAQQRLVVFWYLQTSPILYLTLVVLLLKVTQERQQRVPRVSFSFANDILAQHVANGDDG